MSAPRLARRNLVRLFYAVETRCHYGPAGLTWRLCFDPLWKKYRHYGPALETLLWFRRAEDVGMVANR